MARYGIKVLTKFAFLAVALGIFAMLVIRTDTLRIAALGILAASVFLVVNFFRDPERLVPADPGNLVVSPADGRVVLVKDVEEPEYVGRKAVKVSIFMSPLDVHVNRFPVSGTVELVRRIPGTFIGAFHEKSSDLNERVSIGIRRSDGSRILFTQIAGALARRIVAEVSVGQEATVGERFGMIMFGSRVDVVMPKEAQVAVSLHDRVTAGETVLGRMALVPQRVA